MKILIVDANPAVATRLERSLRCGGSDVTVVTPSASFVASIEDSYDVGLYVTERVDPPMLASALFEGPLPMLILTAELSPEDVVLALDSGADDIIGSPVRLGEIAARLRALTRRAALNEFDRSLQVGDLKVDLDSHQAWRDRVELPLSTREFDLLTTFMRSPGRVLSRGLLLESVWDIADRTTSNVVDQYVGHLRRKVDRPFGRDDIQTVRGAGYRLAIDRAA